MTLHYLPFCASPSDPVFEVPAGAIDAHCHVFGPARRFPFASERKYTPVDAPKERLFALRDHLGFSRNVIVQATCHGNDNAALIDALNAAPGRARGVATVSRDTTDSELDELASAGVRGVRFNFLKRLVDAAPLDVLRDIAGKVARRGWHIVVYFESHDLAALESFLLQLPAPLVIDHMGRPNVSEGIQGPQFQRLMAFVASRPDIWVKVSGAERLTETGPPYDDVVPFARALVEQFPDRVLWGTDWPHPNMISHMPDDGALVDLIPRFAQTSAHQKALLVDNPMRLYWPEEYAA